MCNKTLIKIQTLSVIKQKFIYFVLLMLLQITHDIQNLSRRTSPLWFSICIFLSVPTCIGCRRRWLSRHSCVSAWMFLPCKSFDGPSSLTSSSPTPSSPFGEVDCSVPPSCLPSPCVLAAHIGWKGKKGSRPWWCSALSLRPTSRYWGPVGSQHSSSFGGGIPGKGYIWPPNTICNMFQSHSILHRLLWHICEIHFSSFPLFYQIIQGYGVTVVSLLLWQQYIPSLSFKKAEDPQKKNGASLKRLLGFMTPYTLQFLTVIVFVIVSSLGKFDCRLCFVFV